MKSPAPPLCCTRCGRLAEGRVDGVAICDDCYQISGSCCPEFDPACLDPLPSTRGPDSRLPEEGRR